MEPEGRGGRGGCGGGDGNVGGRSRSGGGRGRRGEAELETAAELVQAVEGAARNGCPAQAEEVGEAPGDHGAVGFSWRRERDRARRATAAARGGGGGMRRLSSSWTAADGGG